MRHLYLKSAIWEILLVFAVSAALSYTVLACFYVDPALHFSPVPAIVSAVVLVVVFAVSATRRTAAIGGPIVAVAVVVSWVAAASVMPDGGYFVDDERNLLIFAMCTTLCPLACYLLSRSRVGTAMLFIVGAFLLAFAQFFYGFGLVLPALVFVIASLALVIFKNYQGALRVSTGLKKVLFTPGFAVALAASAVAVGIGAGAWFGIIAPLHPPALDVKLITEHRALETVQVRGISDVYQEPNLDMTSDQTNDGERTTDDIKESEGGRRVGVTGNAEQLKEDEGSDAPQGSNFLGIDLDVVDDTFDFVTYLMQHWLEALLIALGLATLVAALFAMRRLRRKRRLARIRRLSPSEQVAVLYPFIVSRLARLGIVKTPGQTLGEFALANASATDAFDREAQVPFTAITDDYVAVAYGDAELGEDAAERISAYYGAFWKAARRKVGNVRYFFKSFRL